MTHYLEVYNSMFINYNMLCKNTTSGCKYHIIDGCLLPFSTVLHSITFCFCLYILMVKIIFQVPLGFVPEQKQNKNHMTLAVEINVNLMYWHQNVNCSVLLLLLVLLFVDRKWGRWWHSSEVIRKYGVSAATHYEAAGQVSCSAEVSKWTTGYNKCTSAVIRWPSTTGVIRSNSDTRI